MGRPVCAIMACCSRGFIAGFIVVGSLFNDDAIEVLFVFPSWTTLGGVQGIKERRRSDSGKRRCKKHGARES